jgi:hypothetical protein
MDTFTTITHDMLAGVTGGMDVDNLPLSENIEDRRGEKTTYWERVKARLWPRPPCCWEPGPPSNDPPDEMGKALGVDDIGKPPLKR